MILGFGSSDDSYDKSLMIDELLMIMMVVMIVIVMIVMVMVMVMVMMITMIFIAGYVFSDQPRVWPLATLLAASNVFLPASHVFGRWP
eukprot:1339152-Karenia_brevis.AAC.1